MSQDIELYDYDPIIDREPLSWPEGVGIWRPVHQSIQIKLLDEHGIKASALLNSDVAARYPPGFR